MYGKNTILKQEHDVEGKLDVHSIFYTIQGEGPHAGRAAVFVRLYGCSLACTWCDTEFGSMRTRFSPAKLLESVQATDRSALTQSLIVITGGEPMRQNLAPFIHAALTEGYQVQIETAGIHWNEGLQGQDLAPGAASIVCSPKLGYVHEKIEEHALAFKYIVDAYEQHDPNDGLPMNAVMQRSEKPTSRLYRPPWVRATPELIYVQPLDPQPGRAVARDDHYRANVNYCVDLVMKFGYRLSLQQHKIVGVE